MRGLAKLKIAVFKQRPVLRKIYEQSGNLSLFDYVNSWGVYKGEPGKGFIKVLGKLLKKQMPSGEANKIISEFKRTPLVSTIDHHGILNHPFFINSNLLFSLYKKQEYLLCLSTSGVSLNNSSWPGCLIYHQGREQKRLSMFSDKDKNLSVFSQEAFGKIEINRILKKAENRRLQGLVREIFLNQRVLEQKNFSGQANLASFRLWQKFFPNSPKVIYLPLEDLASEIIREIICKDKRHILHQFVFTEKGRKLIEKYFKNLKGAFGPKGRGSFLFWGIDKKGSRVKLERKDDRLEGPDLGLKLSPSEIGKALKQRKLYPTSLVCFLVMLYYGVTCLGGFNQTNWLTDIKKRFIRLLEELKKQDLAEKIKKIPVDNFAESNLAFLYRQSRLIKASGADIYLEGKDMYVKYFELSKFIKLGKSIETLLPEMYRIVVPEGERENFLLDITDEQIAKANGLERIIKSLLT